jgi:hypothetical protein
MDFGKDNNIKLLSPILKVIYTMLLRGCVVMSIAEASRGGERQGNLSASGRLPQGEALLRRAEIVSQPVSRVLSWTVIHLGPASLQASSSLPESSASHTIGFLFGLAPNGVCRATDCYQPRGALLPHPFTLTAGFASGLAVCFLLHFP